jgi:uncharacterized lipoprotein YddW (UPF0748 family)
MFVTCFYAVWCVAAMMLAASAARAQPAGWVEARDQAPPAIAREFRAAWVATVANIDWPSKPGLPAAQQQAEMDAILDRAAATGLNALVVQVRPSCDAIYPSELEPWSEFLTGRSGEAPSPMYDPLQRWIDGCRARGMELHAWFNPFRARHFQAKGPDAPTHITQRRGDLAKRYDNLQWLDPGEPEARAHTLRVVLDVVRRYDIDGVHFDDYFYPYPKEGQQFPDENSFRKFGAGKARDDWRRESVNQFVKQLYDEVKKLKPHVRVGISPFGIYRPGHPAGIQGFDQYANLYADVRLWLREGWLDYLAPQLYWAVDQRAQSFERLLDWWIANNDQRRHIFAGLYTSRIPSADPARSHSGPRWQPGEILRQVDLSRQRDLGPGGASGQIHFSMIALSEDRAGMARALADGPYAEPALPPATPWLAPTSAAGASAARLAAPTLAAVEIGGSTAVVTAGPLAPGERLIARVRAVGRWSKAVVRFGPRAEISVQGAPGPVDAVSLQRADRFGALSPMATWTTR